MSNVLSGTITRVDLHVERRPGRTVPVVDGLTQVASGFLHRSDPAALVVGPTGLLLSGRDKLYVADTGNNGIQMVGGVRDTTALRRRRSDQVPRQEPLSGRVRSRSGPRSHG